MEGVQHTRRMTAAIVLGLVVLPICAVPLYLGGQYIADSADSDSSNGVLALGLILGVAVPALVAVSVARFRATWTWFPALALGIGSGLLSVVTLFAALFLFFPDAGS
jgi:hypothetical protein